MDNQKAELQFVADTSGVDSGFDKVDRGLKNLEQETQRASSALDVFWGSFAGSFASNAAASIIGGIVDAIKGIPAAISEGSGIDDLTSSFDNLAKQAGATGDVLITKLSSALGDTIPNVDLMRQANELMLGGLKPDQIELVAKAARTFGEVTGTDAAQGMQQFSDSLLRGNDRALKTLGITVDNTKAIEDYAASVRKSTKDLTEQEKVEALRSASLKALAENTQKLGEVTDDSGDVIAQIGKVFSDQAAEALKAIGTNEDLKDALIELRDTIKEVDFKPIIDGLSSVISVAADAVTALIRVGAAIADAFDTRSGAAKGLDQQLSDIDKFKKGLGSLSEAVGAAKSKGDLDKLKGQFDALGKQLQSSKAVADNFTTAWIGLNEGANRLYQTLPKVTQEITKTGTGFKSMDEQAKAAKDRLKEVDDFTKKYADALIKQRDELVKLVTGSERYQRILKDLSAGVIDNKQAGEALNKLYAETKDALDRARVALEQYQKIESLLASGKNVAAEHLAEVAKEANDAKEALDGLSSPALSSGSFLDLLVGKGLDPGQSQVATAIGSALSSAISEAINSGDVLSAIKNAGSSLGQALGSAAGASLGPIGAAVGGSIGQALADKFIKGVENIGKSSQGTGKGIKTIIDSIFPGVGSGIDALVGGKLFGGDSEGTQTRKQIDKFFADAFDAQRLLVIINGQLSQIKDLDLGGGLFGDSSSQAAQYFSGLSESAQAAFGGIAQGFSALLGLGTEASVGLAEALASNVGGSLNNLQLLVEASGKSFEDLKNITVEAFLDGKLSALEAQTALNGIAQVAQKGIPDGIGQVSTAFDNLKAAGTKGGRALVDALQDIGFEAKELGQKDLSQVITTLQATGKYSAAEIQQVFDALKASGITSVDQLTKATVDQLLPVLSQLEATKFPFAEQVKDVRAYIDAVDSIPTSKTVELNFKVNYPSEADRQVVQSISRPGGPGGAQL